MTINLLRFGDNLPLPTDSEGGGWGYHCHLEQRGGGAQAQGGPVCHEGWVTKRYQVGFNYDVVGGHMEDGGHDGNSAVHEGGRGDGDQGHSEGEGELRVIKVQSHFVKSFSQRNASTSLRNT